MIILTIAGRATKDAEQRFTASGSAVLGFSVACDVGFGDKKHTVYVNCSLWGKRGESLAPYIKKGMPLTVSGNGDLREWESNGKSGTTLELNVSEVAMQGGKQAANNSDSGAGNNSNPAQGGGFDDDSDIPFSMEAA